MKTLDDFLTYEQDQKQLLQNQIEAMKKEFNADDSAIKSHQALLLNDIQEKNHTILKLQRQLDTYLEKVSLEFPLVTQAKQAEPFQPINLSNQRPAGPGKQFVSMTGKSKITGLLLQDFEDDLEEVMKNQPFGDLDLEEDRPQIPAKRTNSRNARGKGSQVRKTPMAKKKTAVQSKAKPSVLDMFALADCVQTQLSSVMVADEILKDLQAAKKEKIHSLDQELERQRGVEEKVESIHMEKEALNKRQQELTKDNENLKLKFSQLLDQFQEYVNESERKFEEDQAQHKEEQGKILTELNTNIKELDDMSKNLQNEVTERDQHIEQLQAELAALKEQLEELENAQVEHKEEVVILSNENENLKQHLESLRNENSRLALRTRGATEVVDRSMHNDRSQSQFDPNEENGLYTNS